jgi:hypothetical protein
MRYLVEDETGIRAIRCVSARIKTSIRWILAVLHQSASAQREPAQFPIGTVFRPDAVQEARQPEPGLGELLELPQEFDVIGQPIYQPHELTTPMDVGPPKRRRLSTGFHKLERRRLRGPVSGAQIGLIRNLISTGERLQWGKETGVRVAGFKQSRRSQGKRIGWTIDIEVDVFLVEAPPTK